MAETFDKRIAIAQVYARALFELAQEAGQVDEVRAQLEELARLRAQDSDVAAFFDSPALDTDRRAELLEKWFRGRLSDITLDTLLVMNAHGRTGMIDALLRAFVLRAEEAAGQIEATAVTAVELDQAQRRRVLELAARLTGKAPLIDFQVNPSILGGLILQIGDLRYDDSIRRHLDGVFGRLAERSERGFALQATE